MPQLLKAVKRWQPLVSDGFYFKIDLNFSGILLVKTGTMREFLIYIAYRACISYETWSNSSSWVFTRAKSLIASIIFFHVVQLIILFVDKKHFPLKRIEGELFLTLIITFIGCFIFASSCFQGKYLPNQYQFIKTIGLTVIQSCLRFVIFFWQLH